MPDLEPLVLHLSKLIAHTLTKDPVFLETVAKLQNEFGTERAAKLVGVALLINAQAMELSAEIALTAERKVDQEVDRVLEKALELVEKEEREKK